MGQPGAGASQIIETRNPPTPTTRSASLPRVLRIVRKPRKAIHAAACHHRVWKVLTDTAAVM